MNPYIASGDDFGHFEDSSNDDDEDIDIDYYYDNNTSTSDDCHLQQAIINHESIDTILELIQLFPLKVQHQNKFGRYPLHTACNYGHDNVVMKLIEIFPEAAQHANSLGQYPLHIACRSNRSEDVVIKLIKTFPEAVSKLTPDGTALCFASNKNHSETVIKKLIDMNPFALQETDYQGRFPIHCAIRKDRPIAVIKVLLDSDPLGMKKREEGHFSCDETPFHLACKTENYDVVEYLMQRSDLQINIRDSRGMTPLHYACKELKDKNVAILLHHPDVDVNATDNLNETALHKTINIFGNPEGSVDVLQQLLDHPFIILDLKNNDNKTPLDLMKDRLNELEYYYNPLSPREEEKHRLVKMVNILEEFVIKRRWQAYSYFFKHLIDL